MKDDIRHIMSLSTLVMCLFVYQAMELKKTEAGCGRWWQVLLKNGRASLYCYGEKWQALAGCHYPDH